MKKTGKKRILRMVIFDLLGFCVLSYLICAQVFHFFPWKPVEIELPDLPEAPVIEAKATDTPAPTDTPTATPAPTDAPATTEPDASTETEEATDAPMEETPAPTETPEPTAEPTPEPTPEPKGLLKGKFAEKFSDTLVSTATEYRAPDVAIELSACTKYFCSKCKQFSDAPGTCPNCGAELRDGMRDKVTYTVADIYIQDISSLRTAYATKASETGKVKEMCLANNGILGVNTDYFLNAYANSHGWFYRNGIEIKRYDKLTSDLCILYADGVMETVDISSQAVDHEGIVAREPLQMWYFGPALLGPNGEAKEKFTMSKSVFDANPRTLIGYYEPGHYCFITVDGRGKNRGLSLSELSILCADMGMAAAYNMDGGASSAMYFNGNSYGLNGRETSDIVYIVESGKEN
ncbi:MAG: phosphodiester glycosidase family protein [Clostridia bacterium]|nr:phosphodiester glycosidase family protein [Clostridia bacterium]